MGTSLNGQSVFNERDCILPFGKINAVSGLRVSHIKADGFRHRHERRDCNHRLTADTSDRRRLQIPIIPDFILLGGLHAFVIVAHRRSIALILHIGVVAPCQMSPASGGAFRINDSEPICFDLGNRLPVLRDAKNARYHHIQFVESRVDLTRQGPIVFKRLHEGDGVISSAQKCKIVDFGKEPECL